MPVFVLDHLFILNAEPDNWQNSRNPSLNGAAPKSGPEKFCIVINVTGCAFMLWAFLKAVSVIKSPIPAPIAYFNERGMALIIFFREKNFIRYCFDMPKKRENDGRCSVLYRIDEYYLSCRMSHNL